MRSNSVSVQFCCKLHIERDIFKKLQKTDSKNAFWGVQTFFRIRFSEWSIFRKPFSEVRFSEWKIFQKHFFRTLLSNFPNFIYLFILLPKFFYLFILLLKFF